jgi:copper homeostasis protein
MTEHVPQVLLEVCVGSVADAEAAVAAGADRLELCGALELGGLTPSLGLVEAVVAISPIPVVAMVRPRAGGFRYDRDEFAVMLRDAQRFLDMGASGIVFGILDQYGRIDAARSRELVSLAASVGSVFHRAFDFVADQRTALDTLIETHCQRVLTSGGQSTAVAGAAAIRELAQHAAGRIEVLPGGGVNAGTIAEIVRVTGCRQVHIGASTMCDDGSIHDGSGIELCDRRFMQGVSYRAVKADAVATAKATLKVIDVDDPGAR